MVWFFKNNFEGCLTNSGSEFCFKKRKKKKKGDPLENNSVISPCHHLLLLTVGN